MMTVGKAADKTAGQGPSTATEMAEIGSQIIDPKATRVIAELNVGKPLLRCCFDPAGKHLYTAGQDNRIWRVPVAGAKDGSEISELVGHETWVFGLAMHPEGRLLFSGGGDGNLLCWSLAEKTPKLLRKVSAHQAWIRDVAISPDGKVAATAGNDRVVKLWNTENGRLLQTLEGHTLDIYRVAFHPDGKQLVSGDLTARIKCWEIDSGKLIKELHAPTLHRIDKNHNLHLGGTRALAFDTKGERLAVSGLRAAPNYLGGEVQPGNVIFDFESGEITQQQKTRDNLSTVPWESFFQGDDTLVVSTAGKAGGHLLFWKVDAEDEFHAFALPDVARDMAIDRQRHQIATAHRDGHLRISTLLPEKSDAEIS